MKYLFRTDGPECLKKYKVGSDNWKSVSPEHKQDIRDYLEQMQGEFCAYCESSLDTSKHIEHFANKDQFPKMTFSWINLFLSCGSNIHCGHYKDGNKAPKYSYLDLIKPDQESSRDFFIFNSDGRVSILENLNEENIRKASVSLDVFNLNETDLVNRRSSTLASVEIIVKYIYSLQDVSQIQEYITYYINEYTGSEFSEAKLQLLLPR
jgi:uncharacterized protein (TIGR02646 family)